MASPTWQNSTIKHASDLGVAETTDAYPSIVANIIDGSQLGQGIQLSRIDAATPLILNPVSIIVTSTPSMYDNTPQVQKLIKSLVEGHAKAVTGIDVSYTLETMSTPVGWDGQDLKAPTRTTRAAVDPSFTWNELLGNVVWNCMRKWIFDIQSPDTNASQMSAVLGDEIMSPYMMSSFSMGIAVIQYDMSMRPENIIDGTYIGCMFPTTTGDFGFERSHGTTKPMDRTIPFTGICQHNENTKWLAQELATIHQLHKCNYERAIAGAGAGAQSLIDAVPNSGLMKTQNQIMQFFKKNQLIDPDILT